MESTVNAVKTTWTIDPAHSEIGFKVKHLMISNVRGNFTKYTTNITADGDDFTSAEIEVILDPASISTRDEKRDGHLKSAEFFDALNHEEIKFHSTSIERGDSKNEFKLNGDLNIKGITKGISLDVEFEGMMKDPWGNQKAMFVVKGKINRKNWGLNWNAALETGGVLVSDEVWIKGEIQLQKQA